ncbi:VTT domain-containing protein [Pelotomaculum isophthalicicum JI]|uniref:VTT domain-containing protein n=1 Tax=Pelotomaculum isophthalicicum JI TaxID=947010 RepID=A0A9X4H0M3_9FIRM|nr:VTT domain-containing protein [Pelotomaculum isophthalicicum]MDF9407386.1 VTT domain-containing protein [Pelotomaculum isophthalicicum JI]
MGILEWLQNHDQGLFLFVLSFGNAIILPVGPEIAFVPILLVSHNKLLPYASYCVLGSVLGLGVTYYVSYYLGQAVIEKYVPRNNIVKGMDIFSKYGPLALVVASMFPVFPYRILVIVSGFLRQKPAKVFSYLTIGKTLRFFGYGFLIAKLGESIVKYLE